MTLADLSIKKPVFAWMLMSALIIFGAISLGRLGVSLLPDVEAPTLMITAQWPGAAPEVMETEIVDRLEQALVNVTGIDNIKSTIRQGNTQIELKLIPGRNVDAAMLEVQSNLSRIRLPVDVDPPQIFKVSPSDQEIMWLGVSSPTRSLVDLTIYADRHLRDKFQIIPGVGEILLSGFAERNLRVWVDLDKLEEYELTILDVQNAIRTQHTETAAGIIENPEREINIRVMGEGVDPSAVGDILITQRGGQPIYNSQIKIKDVARVEDSLNDVRSISKIDGVRGAGLGFRKQRGYNSVEVANKIIATLEEIKKTLPEDIKIGVNYNETVFTREAVEETQFTLVLSAILTALVCWLFIGSWSSTVNILLSIPTSVLGTFLILYALGFTLNMFTLLALSLAIGIVVDDAIMVLENIVRHVEMGKDRKQAAAEGTNQIMFAALSASLAIVAVFLPVAFIQGIIGQFLFQFGVTISAAVMLSLVEAITLTPMRCSQMLKVQRDNVLTQFVDKTFHKLTLCYSRILPFILRHRVLTTLVMIILFALTLPLAKMIPKEFSPAQDMSTIMMLFETPIGYSLEATEKKLTEVENYLQTKRPEKKTYFMAVGGFMGGSVNSGIMFMSLVPKKDRALSQQELIEVMRKDMSGIKDLKIIYIDLSKGGPEGGFNRPITFSLQGSSLDVLRKESARMIEVMKEKNLGVDIDTDFKEGQPEIRVHIDRDKAAARGVTAEAVSLTVAYAIGGVREGKFTNDDRRYDLRIRLEPGQRVSAADLGRLKVRNLHGELIPITDVITYEEVSTIQTIARRDRERSITISANNPPGKTEGQCLAEIQKIADQTLPEGYRMIPSDAAEQFLEFFTQMIFALSLGVLIAYMILASQFNSFGHPFIILLAMPYGFSGALLALWMGGQSLNLYSFIGLILLMGIVKKNSILLVEFTNQVREHEGLNVHDSLVKASPIRLRPVLMTSFATIAAAIPPALAIGPGAESRIPMALTIIGGVTVSTFCTLLIVPCSYSIFESLKAWTMQKLHIKSHQTTP